MLVVTVHLDQSLLVLHTVFAAVTFILSFNLNGFAALHSLCFVRWLLSLVAIFLLFRGWSWVSYTSNSRLVGSFTAKNQLLFRLFDLFNQLRVQIAFQLHHL